MKTLWMTLGCLKTIFAWIKEVKRTGKLRLSPERAREDRLALERIVYAMAMGSVKGMPKSLRLLCKWLKRLGLLTSIGEYGQALFKSGKLERNDLALYRVH